MFGEVIEEGRGAHRKVARSLMICRAISSATKMSWRTAVAPSMTGSTRPYMKPSWWAIGEACNDRIGRQAEPLGERAEVGEHGVGRVHHALGLSGRAGGVKELDHIVGGQGRRRLRRAARSWSKASLPCLPPRRHARGRAGPSGLPATMAG